MSSHAVVPVSEQLKASTHFGGESYPYQSSPKPATSYAIESLHSTNDLFSGAESSGSSSYSDGGAGGVKDPPLPLREFAEREKGDSDFFMRYEASERVKTIAR